MYPTTLGTIDATIVFFDEFINNHSKNDLIIDKSSIQYDLTNKCRSQFINNTCNNKKISIDYITKSK
jgi:hypothetical protein